MRMKSYITPIISHPIVTSLQQNGFVFLQKIGPTVACALSINIEKNTFYLETRDTLRHLLCLSLSKLHRN